MSCQHCKDPEDYCETCGAHHRPEQCARKRPEQPNEFWVWYTEGGMPR